MSYRKKLILLALAMVLSLSPAIATTFDYTVAVNRAFNVTPTFADLSQNPSDAENSTDGNWSRTTGWGYDNCTGAWQKSYITYDLGAEYTFHLNYLIGLFASGGNTYYDLQWRYGGTWYTQTISSTTATSETLVQKGTCVLRADQFRFRLQSNGANDISFRIYEVEAIEHVNQTTTISGGSGNTTWLENSDTFIQVMMMLGFGLALIVIFLVIIVGKM